MTYKRVINRNGLSVGNYETDPRNVSSQAFPPKEKFNADVDYLAIVLQDHERLRQQIVSMNNSRSMLLGDLRRLELDSKDEKATALHLSNKTGVDVEVVAAVLKEFLEW